MPLLETKGAASAQGFGLTLQQTAVNYIEDVFSTYLYTGSGLGQTFNNGIDLAGEGGLVWLKSRSAATNNFLFDTTRAALNEINSNTTDAQASLASSLTSFNADGFSLGSAAGINVNQATYVSWTFRKQPKFFDVVTYTGNGTARAINHSLGSVPGCVIVKCTSTAGDWYVTHRSFSTPAAYLLLNSSAAITSGSYFNVNAGGPSPMVNLTETTFGVNTSLNVSGQTYVAYVFAHDAGGFGLTGTDNVISCGSFTTDGSGNFSVNLGYEPQWVLIKQTNTTANWQIMDNMRGMPVSGTTALLNPNLSDAENNGALRVSPSATGFYSGSAGSFNVNAPYIYIAIRRGPMKVPTSGTSVYSGILATSSEAAGTTKTTGFPIDFQLVGWRNTVIGKYAVDRLRSVNSLRLSYPSSSAGALNTTSTSGEDGGTNRTLGFSNTGFNISAAFELNNVVYWNFRRAPGFFDEVCYTGTGATNTLSHNLNALPELTIYKSRSNISDWWVWVATSSNVYVQMRLNSTSAAIGGTFSATAAGLASTTFNPNAAGSGSNTSAATYVAYLFASCPGVSKVGSFTGTSATQVINCGFTAGARFVLIKTTSGTGDWYVWDSARGIVAGNDPYLLLNSTAAEVTTTDWVDTAATGFELTGGANPANIAGATYIFLAIA